MIIMNNNITDNDKPQLITVIFSNIVLFKFI